MLAIKENHQIYIHTEAVDMRKSVNGLSVYIRDDFNKSPSGGDLFVFWNRAKNRLKILWWDKNGFVIYYKRIERHKFKIPSDIAQQELVLTNEQLNWLLAGLDFSLMRTFSDLNYSEYY